MPSKTEIKSYEVDKYGIDFESAEYSYEITPADEQETSAAEESEVKNG